MGHILEKRRFLQFARVTGREGGRKEGVSKGRLRKKEMRSFLRKGATIRWARISFWWLRTDPGHHLTPQSELELIIMDSNIIAGIILIALQAGKISTP